jgi:hypothetical protein
MTTRTHKDELDAAWANRDHFCHWINEIARLFWGDDKQCYAPDATFRMVESLKQRVTQQAATISQLQDAHVVLALKLGDEEIKVARQAAELDKWREREASVCPEDYGFEEVVTQQAATISQLTKVLQESLSLVDESEHDKRAPEYLRQQVRGIVANKIKKALANVHTQEPK